LTLPVVEDSAVAGELWTSLVSLIQSYVAGHELGKRTGHPVVSLDADRRLTIESDGKALAIGWTAGGCTAGEFTEGTGHWVLYDESVGESAGPERVLGRGSFRIGTDSLVEFSDSKGKLELDVAAEAFTAKIFNEE